MRLCDWWCEESRNEGVMDCVIGGVRSPRNEGVMEILIV